jgi:hypothetical protein
LPPRIASQQDLLGETDGQQMHPLGRPCVKKCFGFVTDSGKILKALKK